MLKKSYSKTGRSCRVTFKLPSVPDAASVAVLGEFNGWDDVAHPMAHRKDGSFSTTLSLDAGQEYRFRYLLDGERWLNDNAPDAEVYNAFGGTDCVVAL